CSLAWTKYWPSKPAYSGSKATGAAPGRKVPTGPPPGSGQSDLRRAFRAEDGAGARRDRLAAEGAGGPRVGRVDQLLDAHVEGRVRRPRRRLLLDRRPFGRQERLEASPVDAGPAVERRKPLLDQALDRGVGELADAAEHMGQLDARETVRLDEHLEAASREEGDVP